MTIAPIAPESTRRALPAGVRPVTRSVVLYVVTYLLLFLAVPGVLFVLPAAFGVSVSGPWLDWLLPVAYPVLALAGAWVFRSTLQEAWVLTRRHPWKTIGLILGGFVAAFIAQIGSNLVLELMGSSSTTQNQASIAESFRIVPAVVLIPMITLFGPFVEELIFRETILSRFRRWIPTFVGMIVSAALFALLHWSSADELTALLPYAMLGVVFGVFFILSRRNLLVSFAIHALWNTFGVVVLFLGG